MSIPTLNSLHSTAAMSFHHAQVIEGRHLDPQKLVNSLSAKYGPDGFKVKVRHDPTANYW